MQNDMYRQAAELFANDLYVELVSSGVLEDPDIQCQQTDGLISLNESCRADRNFILWSLIPYIAAWSGEKLMDKSISFEEAATVRPDGANNIFYATVVPEEMVLPDDYVYMKNWCGPMWRKDRNGRLLWWQIDSEWSGRDRQRKAPYAKAVLDTVPSHLKKAKEYEMQFMFHADGWFLLHCITALLKNGKLKRPTKGQRKALTTLIVNI